MIGNINDDATPTSLTVNANGTTRGNVDLQGSVGATAPLNGLTVMADDLRLHSDIHTSNAGGVSGSVILQTYTVTLAGNANPSIATTITIDTDSSGGAQNAGALSITGPIGHLGGTGPVSLVIDTSATGGKLGADMSLPNITGLATLTLAAGTGNVTLNSVTVSAAFVSSGAVFVNTGILTATGVTITHTGVVNINNDIVSPGGAVGITGANITIPQGSPIIGTTVTLADTSGTTISDAVTAPDGFTRSGASFFNLTVTGSITTTDTAITINHLGNVTISGPLAAGTGDVTVTAGAAGIATSPGGSIAGGAITLTGTAANSNISLGDSVTALGALNVTGAAFVNTGIVTATGVTITGSGSVNVNNDIVSASAPVTVTGATITISQGSPITGSTVTLADTNGTTISDAVAAPGGFTSSGASFFHVTVTGSITTTDTAIIINHLAGATISGPLACRHRRCGRYRWRERHRDFTGRQYRRRRDHFDRQRNQWQRLAGRFRDRQRRAQCHRCGV